MVYSDCLTVKLIIDISLPVESLYSFLVCNQESYNMKEAKQREEKNEKRKRERKKQTNKGRSTLSIENRRIKER